MANEERAKALFDNILAETKRPTVAGKTFEYDIFKKYDTQSDTFVDTAVVKQKSSLDVTDNASKRQLRGQTIVTAHQHYLEKTSSYWRKWKSDNDALENLSMLKVKSSPVKKKKSKMRSGRVKNGKLCSFPKQGSIIPSPFPVNGPTSVKYLMKSTQGRTFGGLPSNDGLVLSYDYGSTGSHVSSGGYGSMSSSSIQRPKTIPPIAANCNTPLDADQYLRPSVGNKFQISKRFPEQKDDSNPPRTDDAAPSVELAIAASKKIEPTNLPPYSGKFMIAQRDPPLPGNQPRGPGEYALPTFIDEARRQNKGALFYTHKNNEKDIINHPLQLNKHNQYLDLTPAQYCKEVTFGFGCNMHEHVLYGMCLDGKCGKRAFYENIMLHHADDARMRGDPDERDRLHLVKELHDLKKETKLMERDIHREDYVHIGSSDEEMKNMNGQGSGDDVIDNSASLTPLHVAAHRSDLETIEIMGSQEFDIDAVESTYGRTAVHIAVIRNNQDALKKILDVFHGRIDLNIQDKNGDLPLHLACRSGVELLVEYLCDFDANPVHAKNKKGKYPVDYARTHKTYQILHLTEEKQSAEKELKNLQDIQQKMTTGVVDPDDYIDKQKEDIVVTDVGTKLVADKIYIPTFKELEKKDLWNNRPNRSQVMNLEQKLAAIDASMASGNDDDDDDDDEY